MGRDTCRLWPQITEEMADKLKMKYRDEIDKSYGVAGMALGLSVFDAEDLFTAITLDGDERGSILFTPEFYFSGNPRLSPRGSWQYILGHYRISVGLAVANALCRRMVLDNERVDQQLHDRLLDAACDDGRDYCQLERDEVQPIFDKAFEDTAGTSVDWAPLPSGAYFIRTETPQW